MFFCAVGTHHHNVKKKKITEKSEEWFTVRLFTTGVTTLLCKRIVVPLSGFMFRQLEISYFDDVFARLYCSQDPQARMLHTDR